MRLPSGQQLGYCTNVHPYHTVDGMLAALRRHAVPLRQHLGIEGSLGVGLWLPASVARELAGTGARQLAAQLDALNLHAFTVNAFPYGEFHGEQVKDQVFRPSWAEPERLQYTLAAAAVLAELLPEGEVGSISTHSGAYKPWGAAANDEDALVAGFVAAAQGLAQLQSRTGRRVVLAIEPEPLSFLETTEEVLDLFTRRLLPEAGDAAEYLGLCYDACHQAVQYEDMAASVSALGAAGVRLAKVQLSSALVLRRPAEDRELLRPFADDRWFHQVVTRAGDGSLTRLADLPLALTDPAAARAAEWRVHLHVPLFADPLDPQGRLGTTRPWLQQLLAVVNRCEVTPHLELETYSYSALPAEHAAELGVPDLDSCLAAEFRWVLDQLPGA